MGDVCVAEVTPASAASVAYMINATVRPFRPHIMPPLVRPETFNDDLIMGPFRPSKHVWSGEQRGGGGHARDRRHVNPGPCHERVGPRILPSQGHPLTRRNSRSYGFHAPHPLSLQVDFWKDQLNRAKLVVGQAYDLQQKRYQKVGPRIQSATGKFNFIAMMSLMGQVHTGGKSWAQQFVWGFPITGDLSQTGVYPTDPKVTSAPDFSTIWQESEFRYQTRAKASGWPNAATYGRRPWAKSKRDGFRPPPPYRSQRTMPPLGYRAHRHLLQIWGGPNGQIKGLRRPKVRGRKLILFSMVPDQVTNLGPYRATSVSRPKNKMRLVLL